MNRKALVAMSGGVDSSVAAALMKERGYDCLGVTFRLHDPALDAGDAERAAQGLGMPHRVLDFSEAFRDKVIRRFIETYEAGGTPNPCVDCNRFVKFNLALLRACLSEVCLSGDSLPRGSLPVGREQDFDLLVTGHYARVQAAPSGRLLLYKAADPRKDQSYVLYTLTQDQLARACFPLGELTKDEAREIARDKGLLNADKKDSQDICFVPDGDYGAFMEAYRGKRYPEGDIVDAAGNVLGRHRGIVRYTLGQRRGLGVAANAPVYVTAKNMAANTITLGDESELYTKSLIAGDINLIAVDSLERPLRCAVKTRYLQREKPALAEQVGPDKLRIVFDEPQRAVTPGQAAVLYDGDAVIGGGTIERG